MTPYAEPTRCPACDADHDAHTALDGPDGARPKAGDVSVCLYCAAVLVYTDLMLGRLGLRQAAGEELDRLLEDRRLAAAVLAVRDAAIDHPTRR